MSTHKHIERICLAALAAGLLLTFLFFHAGSLGVRTVSAAAGYVNRLFDDSSVHTVDIVMDDWDSFLDTCTNEEYSSCTIIIDGEAFRNTGIRAKGNTSLTQVAAYGNNRYSFKIEFDHYDEANSYYGLDKLCLNNIIQDNTYMKEFFSYRIMEEAGAAAPLCSYVSISVNGEPWGLYLAVEGIEEAFLTRNYGSNYGSLYKPDSMDMGGRNSETPAKMPEAFPAAMPEVQAEDLPGRMPDGQTEDLPDRMPDGGQGASPGRMGGGQSLMGDGDVLLQYAGDDPDSYPNIFDNAKTEVSEKDKKRLIEALETLNNSEAPESAVDTDSVIRYFTAHNFVLNFDSYTGSMIHNYYLYEQEGTLSMLPWDYNLAFGGFQSAADAVSLINYPIDTPVSGGTVEDRPMLAWIFSDEAYTDQYHQYFSELISGYFESGRFSAEIDTVTELISPYVKEDPTKFCTFEEFEKGADTLKEFCLLRAESVRNQLDGSIGRTAETQDADTLIPSGSLSVSAMGSMNSTGGQKDGTPDPSRTAQMAEAAQTGEAPAEMPDEAGASSTAETPPDGGLAAQGRRMPEGERPGGGSSAESAAALPYPVLLLTAASALILLGGLLFAALFRPRI